MRCRNCDYSLWNVVGRTCPECGTVFLPSAYSFAPNQVRFCCPGCDQEYYGTSTSGHLLPPEFTCVRCGVHCSMDTNMVLRSLPGMESAEAITDDLPWTRRKTMGRWTAWWRTFKLCLGSPSRMGMAISRNAHTDTLSWLGTLLIPSAVVGLLFGALMLALVFFARTAGRSAAPGLSDFTPILVITLVAVFLGAILLGMLSLAAVFSWLILKRKDPGLTYSKVLACWAYGATPTVLMSIPCLGTHCLGPAMLGWVPALAGIMLAQVARASGMRVAVSVVVPPLALILSCGTGYAALIYAVVTMSPPRVTVSPPPPSIQNGSGSSATSPGDADDSSEDADDVEMDHSPQTSSALMSGALMRGALTPWTTAWCSLPSR